MHELAWVNGTITEIADARISIEDRGFLFGDGVYETVRIYRGKPFCLPEHLGRLARSAAAIEIGLPFTGEELELIVGKLLGESAADEGYLYMQLTRGVAPRNHLFPGDTRPTLVLYVRALPPGFGSVTDSGAHCATVPDERWMHCHIKSVNLLPNLLAKEKARRAGAYEAILYRPGGVVTEGSSSNVFAVLEGIVYTHPESEIILTGITRQVILGLLTENGIPYREEAILLDQLRGAGEIWVSSSIAEIVPVIALDGSPVGPGTPGPVTRLVIDAYRAVVARACGETGRPVGSRDGDTAGS